MKNFVILSLFMFLFLFISTSVFSQEVTFENGTYNEVLEKAKKENKIVMIDFFTDWCKWCLELDKKVYTDINVANFANMNQINWKIDAEKGEGPELTKKYKITGYPTIVFVNYDGTEIDRIIGYIHAKEFYEVMKDYNEGKNTKGSLNKILKKDPTNPEANYKTGEKLFNEGNENNAKMYFKKVIDYDPQNYSGWTDDAVLMLSVLNGDVEEIRRFASEYPSSNKLKDACLYLGEVYYQKKNDFDSAKYCYKMAFEKYGNDDNSIRFSYGQFLLAWMSKITRDSNSSEQDFIRGLSIAEECYQYVEGSANEGSLSYYKSELYYKLNDIENANKEIDKALRIQDKKAFREQKNKINTKN